MVVETRQKSFGVTIPYSQSICRQRSFGFGVENKKYTREKNFLFFYLFL